MSDYLPERLEQMVRTAEKRLEHLAQVDGKGALLLKIRQHLNPEIRRDIMALMGGISSRMPEKYFEEHKKVVRFFNTVGYSGESFSVRGIEEYESLYLCRELAKIVDSEQGKVAALQSRSPDSEKRTMLEELTQAIHNMDSKDKYYFREHNNGFRIEIPGTNHDSPAFWLPNHYKEEMNRQAGGRGWLENSHDDITLAMNFYMLKPKHCAEEKSSLPGKINAQKLTISQAHDRLNAEGGRLTEYGERKLQLFFSGNAPTYNPPNYLAHFERWQRAEFKRQMRRY